MSIASIISPNNLSLYLNTVKEGINIANTVVTSSDANNRYTLVLPEKPEQEALVPVIESIDNDTVKLAWFTPDGGVQPDLVVNSLTANEFIKVKSVANECTLTYTGTEDTNLVLPAQAPTNNGDVLTGLTNGETRWTPTSSIIASPRPSYSYSFLGSATAEFTIEENQYENIWQHTFNGASLTGYYRLEYNLAYAVNSNSRRNYQLSISNGGRAWNDGLGFNGFSIVVPQESQVRFGTQNSQPAATGFFCYQHVYASWIVQGNGQQLTLRGNIRRESDEGGTQNDIKLDTFNATLTPIDGSPGNFYTPA